MENSSFSFILDEIKIMSSPFSWRKASLWATEGNKPEVWRMFGGGENKETVISEWKTLQKMSNFDKFSSNKAEKNGENQEEVTKRRSLTSWASGHHILLTLINGQQEDTFGQNKKNKNFIYMIFAYILILTKTKILIYMVFAYILFFGNLNPFS